MRRATLLLTTLTVLALLGTPALAAPLSVPDDVYTRALLHFDGADTSTTFTDETLKTWTANGNAQIDTAQFVFGTASGLFDGTGDNITTPDQADWRLDQGADANKWTIDFRVRFATDPGTGVVGLLQQRVDNNNRWDFSLENNQLRFISVAAGVVNIQIDNAWNPAATTWYHIAIVKNGTAGYMVFVNGAQIGSTQTDTSTLANLAAILTVGQETTAGGTFGLNGWLDELRISSGIARWTTNFTPPTAAYTQPDVITPLPDGPGVWHWLSPPVTIVDIGPTTASTNWIDADVTSVTSATTMYVLVRWYSSGGYGDATDTWLSIHRNGDAGEIYFIVPPSQTDWIPFQTMVTVAVDGGQVLEYKVAPGTGAAIYTNLQLVAYLDAVPEEDPPLFDSVIGYSDLAMFSAIMCILGIVILFGLTWGITTLMARRPS